MSDNVTEQTERVWVEAAPPPFSTVVWTRVEYTTHLERWLAPIGWISRVGEDNNWQYGNHGCGVLGTATSLSHALEHFQSALENQDADYVQCALSEVDT